VRRYDAVNAIVECLEKEYVIACNGMISREFFAKDRAKNFYMLGSMGLASAIGLGVSLAKPNKKIVTVVGDGNILMSLGTLATIGKTSPKNLIHIVIDNECHESTGGQETSSSITKLAITASSSGFANSQSVDSIDMLKKILKKFLRLEGPSFIHIKVNKERVEVPRVNLTPPAIKDRFMKELLKS
jgi:thiamine pyrophosphate-dependent acetolactate synthase large subunit-like protein